MNRSIRRLYLTLAGGFALLLLMLGYWQVVAADELQRPPGQPPDASRPSARSTAARIITADGKVLATSRARRVKGQRSSSGSTRTAPWPRTWWATRSEREGKTGIEATYNRYLSGSFGTEPLLQRLNLKEKAGRRRAPDRWTRGCRRWPRRPWATSAARSWRSTRAPAQVLAMASTPGFDLATVATDFDAIRHAAGLAASQPRDRRAATRPARPSRWSRPTAAPRQRAVHARQPTFDDTGSVYETPGGPIRNFGGESFGAAHAHHALTYSINTTFADDRRRARRRAAGRHDDRVRLRQAAADRPARGRGADLGPAEPRRQVLLPNDQTGEDTARIAIGQEQLAVTPLQMAMVAGAVANGGVLMAPRLMDAHHGPRRLGGAARRARRRSGQVDEPADRGRAERDDGATWCARAPARPRRCSSAGVTVAGKTGTAETDDAEPQPGLVHRLRAGRGPAGGRGGRGRGHPVRRAAPWPRRSPPR